MNFRELNNLLINAGSACHAAECHGFLCGYLCHGDVVNDDIFKQYLFSDMMDPEVLTECNRKLYELAAEVGAAIRAHDFTLELFLPADSCSLAERSAALARWCEGFLNGLGIAGLPEFDLLSDEGREVIQDLYKICRIDVENIAETGEDEESAFMELVEYVRMGAMLLYEEFQQINVSDENRRKLH